ncbi:hypothetical protein M406DRAFT_341858 [Cryphonectria parasitica EP155]|uniref:G-protein coupled receptors family 2 profile 2 domain-containing protein n=1 Tax=Cryphonectria parasitica (strain ATCC 38755 / EP155) TaxID=660469 RepID=A0A9P4XXF1_CRYP1|nr:uncharacterized protein M406DRAFT_341858 [Cryphonectria parasitica EP155]KAF3762689.1 hypothetical protein M406DRAFT_341858 [Cryphonectria parasitica EP155]
MLDEDQINTLNAVERMGASLSLTGIILIFITFAIFKRLRTIPNTFIFFASIANIGACVACMIGYDGIVAMNQDRSSPLCQAQGFIFEWFMQSDPWWSFAMAINVYMVFFMSCNPTTFRHYLWLYCIICYGLPAIPAFIFLFVRMPKGLIYGDAVLWCWIASQWNALRIYSYYLPIWICSVLSAVIYFAVGYHVFHQRNQLRNLSLSNQGKDAMREDSDLRDSAEKNLTSHSGSGYYGTVTTEVQVTSAAISPNSLPAYHRRSSNSNSSGVDKSKTNSSKNIFRSVSHGTRRFGQRLRHMDPVKLAYLRTSFVFAISILVTWTPSSINRVYTLIYPDRASYGLNIAAAVVLPLQGVWNAVIYFTTSPSSEDLETGQSGGSFALGSSARSPRSEMGRSRRLDGESRDGDEGVELQSPLSSPVVSPVVTPRRPQPVRMSTMRVTQKQLDQLN